MVGESFDTSGMVVTATYSNGATVQATGYLVEPSGPLKTEDTSVTVIYTEDGKTATATQEISVTRVSLTVPIASGTLTYTGSSQSPTWSGYDSSTMSIGGTTSAANAGSYTATFTIKDTAAYQWSDNTTDAKSVTWTIGKATGTITGVPDSITLNSSTTIYSFAVGGNWDGTLSVTSSNTAVTTVSVSGSTVTVSSVNDTTGEATITVSCTEGTNYTAASGTVSVTAAFRDPLITDSWSTISSRAKNGTAANYYAVGDAKAITVNGTVGTLSINQTLYVFIIGFDHDGNTNTIDWQGFKTAASSGNCICLIDEMVETKNIYGSKYFNMCHWGDYNYGGWKGCDLRYDILGSTNKAPSGYGSTPTSSRVGYDATTTCATSPVSNTLMAALPSDLRAVMKPMTIYTDNTGDGTNTATCVTASVDYLPLLAEGEVSYLPSSIWENSNPYEKNYQSKYEYYENGNSPRMYGHSKTSEWYTCWLRSPFYGDERFCYMANGWADSSGIGSPSYDYGLSPIFRV
jgi:hypothetical protein